MLGLTAHDTAIAARLFCALAVIGWIAFLIMYAVYLILSGLR